AMFLLAYFRERRAYPVLVALFSHPGEAILELTGDAVLNNGSQMLASVCGGTGGLFSGVEGNSGNPKRGNPGGADLSGAPGRGDPSLSQANPTPPDLSGIKALIEGEQVNEFIRALSMEALIFLVKGGRLTRDDVVPYLLELFRKLERRPGHHWDELALAAVALWPQETLEELKRAFADGLIADDIMEWREIEEALAEGPARATRPWRRRPFITDLEQDMGWMQAFQTDSPRRARRSEHQRGRAN
ncbi:MAG TPA: DUF1186 domain-containing protein, partial [Candidatus Limnocylindrales bacterium]|nr:DUF1186 domain-containing protein [Candidatus Limnocylindrales bacterium]